MAKTKKGTLAAELIRRSLEAGAPGLSQATRDAIVRSIILKLSGHGILADD